MNPLVPVAGALVFWGGWRTWRSIFPPRQGLVDVLSMPRRRMTPAPIVAPQRAGGPLSWLGRRNDLASRVVSSSFSVDLCLVQKSREQHVGEKVGLALAGVLFPSLMMSLALATGTTPPVVPLSVLGMMLAAAGFFAPDVMVRVVAAERRREFNHGLRAYTRAVSAELAGGSGLDDALYECARTGLPSGELDGPPVRIGAPGWVLQHIFAVLHLGRKARQSSSSALRQLAVELGLPELTIFASKVAQSEAEGARTRESFDAMARSMSVKVNHQELRKANAVSEAMTGPMMLVLVSLALVLLFPPGYHLVSGFR